MFPDLLCITFRVALGVQAPRATRKLAQEAQKTWRRLRRHEQILLVMAGKKFIDGELEAVA
jgi:hypothetical protein